MFVHRDRPVLLEKAGRVLDHERLADRLVLVLAPGLPPHLLQRLELPLHYPLLQNQQQHLQPVHLALSHLHSLHTQLFQVLPQHGSPELADSFFYEVAPVSFAQHVELEELDGESGVVEGDLLEDADQVVELALVVLLHGFEQPPPRGGEECGILGGE